MFSCPRRTVCCFLVLGCVFLINILNYSKTLSLLNIHVIFYLLIFDDFKDDRYIVWFDDKNIEQHAQICPGLPYLIYFLHFDLQTVN